MLSGVVGGGLQVKDDMGINFHMVCIFAYLLLLIVHEICKRVQTKTNIPTYRGSPVYSASVFMTQNPETYL